MGTIVDVFPIQFDISNYRFSAFKLKGKEANQIAQKLAYRVRKVLNIPCTWIWSDYCLVASAELTEEKLQKLLDELWQNKALEDFNKIIGFELDKNWQPSAGTIATFVALGMLENANQEVEKVLDSSTINGKLIIKKTAKWRGLVVDGVPSLQVTIESDLISAIMLKQFYESGFESPEQLIGYQVTYGSMKGVIQSYQGTIGEYRSSLVKQTPDEKLQKIIQESIESDFVLGIKTASSQTIYNYPIGALRLIVTMGSLKDIDIKPADVQRHLRLKPSDRNQYTTKVSREIRRYATQSKAINIGDAYSVNTHPHLFLDANQIGFNTKLLFGHNGITTINSDQDVLNALKKHSIYRLGDDFTEDKSIRIGILNMLPNYGQNKDQWVFQELHGKIKDVLKPIGFELPSSIKQEFVSDKISPVEQRAQLERGLKKLMEHNPHIILIYLPDFDKYNNDESSLYNRAKSVCVGAGVPSQVVYHGTLQNKYAVANIVMGILGKIGNIPYVLAEPIPYADVVVGLDVSRRAKTKNAGANSIMAMSRIYLNNGEFIGYSLNGSPIDGETIPARVLETLFPESEFGGKRVIIHRDGNFRGDELTNLHRWGKSIGAMFLPIEVTKSGAARLYEKLSGGISQATKGDAFIIDEQTAYLVSSPPPFPNATAMPLTVKNYSSLSLREALHSVLTLTLLHYGSVRPPKLPVSTHFSDEIAGLLSQGIYPPKATGNKPYWL